MWSPTLRFFHRSRRDLEGLEDEDGGEADEDDREQQRFVVLADGRFFGVAVVVLIGHSPGLYSGRRRTPNLARKLLKIQEKILANRLQITAVNNRL